MNGMYRDDQMRQAQHERFMAELAVCQRIHRAGLKHDALEVAALFGITTDFKRRIEDERSLKNTAIERAEV